MNRHTDFIRRMLPLLAVTIGVMPAMAGPPRPATDAEIAEMIAAAGDAEDYPGANLLYVLDEADVFVQESGLATTESCEVIKVLTDAGVRSQSVMVYEFDPDTYRVTIKSVRVHRADGTVEEVPLSSLVTQPSRQWMIYWGGKQHLLPIPRLEIGDSLEIRVSKIGFNIAYLEEGNGGSGGSGDGGEGLTPPMPGHWYEVTLFQGSHPILQKRYSVHMPKSMPIQYEVYNGELKSSLWYDGDYNVYTWVDEDIPAVKREPHMIAMSDAVPKLVMATLGAWEEKSRWFYEVNEGQFEADDAIREKVAEITAGLTDEEDKIAACLHWVADNVRYYGTKRGACEGFTIHRSTETFRDRGGVCKDKAGMLVTMLRVLGHDTFAALTMAGSRVEAIPADQFNHTVTVMRTEDGGFRILDPTWSPLSREIWSSREAKQGLVYGVPEGETLTLSPYFPPDYNLYACRSEGTIAEDGTLSARLLMKLHGYPCTYLRRTVARHPKPRQRAAFEEAVNIAPNATIESLSFTDPYDYSEDGAVDMTVSATGYAAGGARVHMFRLPLLTHPLASFFMPDLSYDVSAESRKYGMRLRATREIRYEDSLKLPQGWKVSHVPDAVSIDNEAASLNFEATPGDGVLKYYFVLKMKKHLVPAEEYPGYKEVIDAAQAIADDWIVCRIGDDKTELAKQAARPAEEAEVHHD